MRNETQHFSRFVGFHYVQPNLRWLRFLALTQAYWNKTHILVATWLLTMPLYLLAFSPAIAVWLAEWQHSEMSLLALNPLVHLLQGLGLSIIFATLLHTLTIPLWQSIKAVLYRELR